MLIFKKLSAMDYTVLNTDVLPGVNPMTFTQAELAGSEVLQGTQTVPVESLFTHSDTITAYPVRVGGTHVQTGIRNTAL